jgi:hypothetical protein
VIWGRLVVGHAAVAGKKELQNDVSNTNGKYGILQYGPMRERVASSD